MISECAVMKGMELIGQCGLYCGICAIYRAERDSPAFRKQIADQHGSSADEVSCQGCGALTPQCWGFNCQIKQCLKDREIEYCDDCPNYEKRLCDLFEDLADKYDKAGIDLRDNLEIIRTGRIDLLANSLERIYTCKSCGKLRAVRADKCHHCGAPADYR